MALATLLVSCNKDNEKSMGLGFWNVESEDDSYVGYSNLYHAWYYFDEQKEGFDICFSDKGNFSNRSKSQWAYVDLAKSFCGVEHSLTENLDSDNWGFYGATKTSEIFYDISFSEGTVFLNVDMEANSIVFRLNGTTERGNKIKIDYVGSAKRMDDMVDPS